MNVIAAWLDRHNSQSRTAQNCEPSLKEHVRQRQAEILARLERIEAETDVWLRRERR